MPDNSSNATALRAGGNYAPAYLSDLSGSQVLQATLTATPTYPATSLTVTINSGSISDVQRGYRIVVTSSTGAFKGTLTVRASGTIDSTHIPIRETSQGAINFVSGDIIYIFDDVYLSDKIPTNDETFSPDGLAVSDYTSNPPPLPKSGGHYAGWLSWGEVPFTGTGSETVDPDSSSGVTHGWSGTGSPSFTTGSSSSADPGLTWASAGKYRVDHEVEDVDSSKTITQHVRVRLHDANDMPYQVMVDLSPSVSEDSGWSISVETRDSVPVSTLRDGSLVALWVENPDGTRPSYGAADNGRHHMLMVGYLRRDTSFISPSGNTVRFDIISPMAKLAELPGFSKVMERNQTPDAWSEIKSLTMKRAQINLIMFYSWLVEAGFDVVFNGFDDADYPLLFCEKNNPLDQWRELAAGRAARVVCLRTGRFEVQERLAVQAVASRAAHTKTYTLSMADVATGEDGSDGVEFTREHYEPVETFRAQGFIAGTSADLPAFFGRWPQSPNTGNSSDTQTRFVLDDNAQGFAWTAMLGAEQNRTYMVDDDSKDHAPEARVPLTGGYWAIFDFYREWIAFSGYDASSNLRGVSLDAFRWQFKGMSVTWDENLVPHAVLELQAETAGLGAVDDTPPAQDGSPEFPDIEIDWPLPDGTITPLPVYGGEPGDMWAMDNANPPVIVYSSDTGATWTQNSYSGLTGTGIWGCSDPWKKKRKFILTSDGLFKTEDIRTTSGTFTQVATPLELFGDASRVGHLVFMSPNFAGLIFALSGNSGYAVTANYGTSWFQGGLDGGAGSFAASVSNPNAINRGYAAISPRSGGAYGGVLISQVRDGSSMKFYCAVDKGLSGTWTLTDTIGGAFPRNGGIAIPLNRDDGSPNWPDASMQFYTSGVFASGSGVPQVRRSADRGVNVDAVFSPASSDDGNNGGSPLNINDHYLYVPDTSGADHWYRVDRQTQVATLMGAGASATIQNKDSNVHGWPYNDNFILHFCRHIDGSNRGGLHYSADGGATWTSITPSQFGGTPSVAYAEGDIGFEGP